MRYIEDSDGESVVKAFSLHWMAWIWFWLWVVLAIPTVGITLLAAGYEWLRLRSTELGVTNKRVICKRGIVSRHTEEMKIGSIETVVIDQSVLGRMLGYGDVRVTGRGISAVVLPQVADPMAVKRQIESISHPAA